MSEKKIKNKILYLSFNKDKSCLSLGMQNGYRIYDLTKKDNLFFYERNFGKGIGIIEMLEKTNILGLVGGGSDPWDKPNKLFIYDDREGKVIANFGFRNNILNIRLKKDKMLIICETHIFLINFGDYKTIESISLGEEKRSIVGFAFTLNSQVNKLAYNFINSVENKIIVNNYDENNKKTSIEIKSNFKQNNLIRFMEFSKKGQFLVVAAVKSRYLELFNSETGFSICKCDMESDSLNVKFICFSKDNDFLCCSLYGECFIFNIKSVVNTQEEDEEMGNLNNIEINRDIKLKIWSKFYLPEKKAICSFIHFLEDEQDKEYVVCIGIKGNYYLVKFDKDKSDTLAEKVCEKYFLKNDC